MDLKGSDAVSKILSSRFQEDEKDLVVHKDPCELKQGQEVIMCPVDTGYNSKDAGKLVGLSIYEAVVKTKSQQEEREIRIHYPRWNFAIDAVPKAAASGQ
ncbi:hypothetical protein M433DRAFT_192292 [Acidomyces richmondensis BFW]|nr:hypothetical protein M433DRAFT_192292 [Acidomyces richmondensis BFW]